MAGISRISFRGDLLNGINTNKSTQNIDTDNIQTASNNVADESEAVQSKAVAADGNQKADTKKEKESKKVKEKVVYVSKNPDRAVSATGVVAGTSGMVGGAVLGGMVGVSKLPGEYLRTVAGQDYAKIITDSADGFKTAIKNSPEMAKLIQTIKSAKSPAVAEEILNIASTMSERLHGAFANDPHASAVIDKVLDPIIGGISVKKNLRSYGSGLRGQVKSPIGQTILKFLGFNKKTSKIVKGITGNFAEGFTKAVENIRNFTPEEKQAWGKVAKQMFAEFDNNPKIKVSKDMIGAISGLGKDFKWFSEPFKAMQTAILDGFKRIDKGLGMAPIKTIGKWSIAGAATCGVLSLLGWAGLKKGLMKKETAKTEAVQA